MPVKSVTIDLTGPVTNEQLELDWDTKSFDSRGQLPVASSSQTTASACGPVNGPSIRDDVMRSSDFARARNREIYQSRDTIEFIINWGGI